MKFAGKTDKGRVRSSNQDDFAANFLPGGGVCAVVCDGMGGANGGNIASSTSVKIISQTIADGYNENLDENGIKELISSAVDKANAAVFNMSREDSSLMGMGTTVVVAVAAGGCITVANAGDSRAYLIDDGITQLTHDHSIVQEMLENGKITSDEALVHPQKNIITRALGVEQNLNLEFNTVDFKAGSTVLICTDGLTNMVPNDVIGSVARNFPPEECVTKLVEMANENGGNDNITVVVICNALTGGMING